MINSRWIRIARRFLGRLLTVIATLIAVSALVFFLGRLFVPGDAATMIVGSEGASPEQAEQLRARLGLDKPLFQQYLDWIRGVAQGDFGVSPIHERNVSDDIRAQLPVSMQLSAYGLALAVAIGIPTGIVAAHYHNRLLDLVLRGVTLTLLSVPMFVFGVVFVLLAALYVPQLYTIQYVPWGVSPIANLRSLFLPSLAIGLPVAAMLSQVTRTAMIETASETFIEAARAKGLSRTRIALVHMLRNASPPIVTIVGFQFGLLLGGVVVIEEIFNMPGLGRGLLLALSQRDFSMLMAGTMTIAAVFVIVNLLVDLVYPILDPRQR